jgi:uncharacterized protein (TIGR02246 family)
MTDDERAIRELVEEWMAASKAGDTKAVLELMTDDVVFMVPGREPFGKEEFRATSEGMRDFRMEGRADVEEVRVLGNSAWIRNHIEVEITPPDGETMSRSGYTLTILEKGRDGRWRLSRDANLVV